ncbi:MAG: hypothetical protein EP343_30220 [Deltaproteobacteria bacterium]|nr:MAG: hypothetical protein EP343_30220 [Deltaproteobacteria bacterium]
MPFTNPHILIPLLNPEASLEALEQILSPQQIQLIMRLDRNTTAKDIAQLTSRSLTDVLDDIKDLALQGVLQLYQRQSQNGRLQRVLWPPPVKEWLELPGLGDTLTDNKDTEPEIYTISSANLPAATEETLTDGRNTPITVRNPIKSSK